MNLLRNFKRASAHSAEPRKDKDSYLPSPHGALSTFVPPKSIALANEEVNSELKRPLKRKPGEYNVYSEEEKAKIAQRATEMGVTSTIKHYNKGEFSERPLKESTARTWMNQYKKELAFRKYTFKNGNDPPMEVSKLVSRIRGRPLLFGEELDKQLQSYIKIYSEHVNTHIVIATGKGIVRGYDSNLLEINGGHISLSKEWAISALKRMGYVKRKASTKMSVKPDDFETMKHQFLFDISCITDIEEIPSALIVNLDHTGLNYMYVPVGQWTMAKEGSTRVAITGINDKRQITAVFAGTMSGDFLPPQIIYSGKTAKCLPSVAFPTDWDITYTHNHWANESTTESYINKILVPYFAKAREELKLDPTYPALVIFDRFKGQCTAKILIIPPNCTDRLQPLDLSVNKSANDYLRSLFQEWYAEKIRLHVTIDDNGTPMSNYQPIDLRMSIVKSLSAKWLMQMYQYFKENPQIIKNGFKEAGLLKE